MCRSSQIIQFVYLVALVCGAGSKDTPGGMADKVMERVCTLRSLPLLGLDSTALAKPSRWGNLAPSQSSARFPYPRLQPCWPFTNTAQPRPHVFVSGLAEQPGSLGSTSLLPSHEKGTLAFESASMERLDFPLVMADLISRARLGRAKEMLAESTISPPSNLTEVREAYALVHEIMEAGVITPLRSIIDVRTEVDRLRSTTALEVDELIRIRDSVDSLLELRDFLWGLGLRAPLMGRIACRIEIDHAMFVALDGAFTEGKLSGGRFPDVKYWREEVARANGAITSKVKSLMREPKFKALLPKDANTTSVTSVVNGRVVFRVPSKGRKISGVVHDISRDGKTTFVEPNALVKLANDQTDAEAHLQLAEMRALVNLSFVVGKSREPLLTSIDAAAELDAARAKADIGKAWDGIVPDVKDEGRIDTAGLKNAVLAMAPGGYGSVGNDIDLDIGKNDAPQGLLISGPNGGGKTVVMKAVAIAALLVRLGVPIPARQKARFDLFSPVLAVVGDAQSLAGKVSTFQAHCTLLGQVLRRARPASLLVLDELGTGTDPAQGAVLAQAVLEELLDRGAIVLSTTHYTRVKDFAVKDDRMAFGAMLLDEKGWPSYRLHIPGVGESHGLEIAKRTLGGEFDEVLNRARGLMDPQEEELRDLLLKIEKKANDLEAGQQRLKKEQAAIQHADEAVLQKRQTAQKDFMHAKVEAMRSWRDRVASTEDDLEVSMHWARAKRDIQSSLEIAFSGCDVERARAALDAELGSLAPAPAPVPVATAEDLKSKPMSLLLAESTWRSLRHSSDRLARDAAQEDLKRERRAWQSLKRLVAEREEHDLKRSALKWNV